MQHNFLACPHDLINETLSQESEICHHTILLQSCCFNNDFPFINMSFLLTMISTYSNKKVIKLNNNMVNMLILAKLSMNFSAEVEL